MPDCVIQHRNESQAAPLVAHVFPTFAVGGAQVRFAAVANHFGPAFRHIVVALDGNLGCRERLRPDLDIIFPEVGAAKNAMLRDAVRFRRMVQAWAPDVLVTCNWGAIEFALANVLPVTRHLHVVDGFGPEEREAEIPRRIWLRRLALSRSPVVLPSCTLVRIATEVWKLPRRVIHHVPNGVDLARFACTRPWRSGTGPGGGSEQDDPRSERSSRSISSSGRVIQASGGSAVGHHALMGGPADEPVIGTVAALRPEKNLGRLLRAFAQLPAGRLVIVGDGAERDALQALTRAAGVAERVEFAGQRSDAAAFYRRFDLFALSSDTEQMPLSVMEAMASGLPVVSTDVGDVRQMLAEENAGYVTPRNDAAFAAAMATLIRDPALRQKLGAVNRAKAERDFDQAAMFAAHGALWRGVAGSA